MLHKLLLIQHDHLPAQQQAQLRANDLLLLRTHALRNGLAYSGTRIGARSGAGGARLCGGRFALADGRGGEIVLLVDGLDGALEAAEEAFGADEGGVEVDGVGELVDYR